jgi:hypothetical protein
MYAACELDQLSLHDQHSSPLSEAQEVESPSLSSEQEVLEELAKLEDALGMPGEAEEYAEQPDEAEEPHLAEGPDAAEEYVKEFYGGAETQEPVEQEELSWEEFYAQMDQEAHQLQYRLAPPAEAREQYAVPSVAEEPQFQWGEDDYAPSGKAPTWEQTVQEARGQIAHQEFVAAQQQAWDSRPGVPMDTSAGRTRFSVRRMEAPQLAAKVCYHCQKVGHVRARCPNRSAKRVRAPPSPQAPKGIVMRGRIPYKGDNVTDRPVTRRKSVTFDSKAKVGALVQERAPLRSRRRQKKPKKTSGKTTGKPIHVQ